MPPGKVDVLKLKAKGKATAVKKGGAIVLQARDPVGALQAIAGQARIRIELGPDEVACLKAAGRLAVSLEYADSLAGASEAAKQVMDLARSGASQEEPGRVGLGRKLVFLLLLFAMAAVVFALTFGVLERLYGPGAP